MKALLVLITVLVLSACQTVGYVGQAALGHVRLMVGREPIDELLASQSLDPTLNHQLQLVVLARDFAATELGLPANGSFTSYVELDRAFPIWNVFAAPRYSLTPISWCFPIAGCVSYRGYFSKDAANRYAEQLADNGMDVYVAGAEAYSTLGWFNDPLTSAVLWRNDSQLIALVIHELVHQHYYQPGDTAFNESLASFIEQEGLRRWYLKHPEGAGVMAAYEARQQQQLEFVDFVLSYRDRFAQLYQSVSIGDADKAALQREMRQDWQRRGDLAGYQGFFAGPLNNAQLSTVAAYFDWVPAFERLLAETGGDLAQFYHRVEALMRLPDDARKQALTALTDS